MAIVSLQGDKIQRLEFEQRTESYYLKKKTIEYLEIKSKLNIQWPSLTTTERINMLEDVLKDSV